MPLGDEGNFFDVDEVASEAGVGARTIRRELARRDGRQPETGQAAELAHMIRADLIARIRELEERVAELTGQA